MITGMIRMLEAGKFLGEMERQGKTLAKLVARFEGERLEELLKVLHGISKATKQPPTMSADGDDASWASEQKLGQLRLQHIDGRWYIRPR